MNIKVLLIVLLFSSQLGFSQVPFQVTVAKETGSGSFVGRGITEDINGDIFAISTGGFGLSRLHLTKVNQQGIIEWDTLYSFTSFAEFEPIIIPAHDGGVIIGSTSFSYPFPDQDSIQDILLWKINVNGTIEWQTVIESYRIKEMIPSKDGSYLVLGSELDKGQNIICCKVSLDGDLEWRKIISDSKYGIWPKTFSEIDGYIYISGQKITTTNSLRDNYIYKVDNNGKKVWEITLRKKLQTQVTSISQIFEFDSKIYFRWDMHYILNSNGSYESLDSTNTFREYAYDISCNKKQLIAVQDIPDVSNTIIYKQFDYIGNSIKELEISNIIGNIRSTVKTSDEGFAILTSSTGSDTIQITKVDCEGNIDFWSEDCKSKIRENSNAILYPNPTENILNIEASFNFEKVKIYNLQGQDITFETLCECNKFSIDVSFLLAGLYFIIIEGEGEVATEKFLKN